jgi:hypothetical protein
MSDIVDLFPSKTPEVVSTRNPNTVIRIIGWANFLIGFIVFIFVGTPLQNIINGGKFWLVCISIGILVFIGLIIFFKLKWPSILVGKSIKDVIYWGYLAGSILFVLDTASLINTTFASSKVETQIFTITQKDISSGDKLGITHDYFIHCTNNGDEVVLQINKSSWDKLAENGIVELYVKRGYFNCNYVTGFHIP